MSEQTKVATKVRVLADVRVVAEFDISSAERAHRWVHGCAMPAEERARRLEREIAEFEAFMRDHRSQDLVRLEVERIVQDQCSACHQEWETYVEDDETTRCAYCGAPVPERRDQEEGR